VTHQYVVSMRNIYLTHTVKKMRNVLFFAFQIDNSDISAHILKSNMFIWKIKFILIEKISMYINLLLLLSAKILYLKKDKIMRF